LIHVAQLVRRPRPNDFSVERLDADVRTNLPDDCRVTVHVCRNFSLGFLPRLADALAARRTKGDVLHVTGDVHYLTYFLDPRRTVLTVLDLVSLTKTRGLRRWALWLLWYWLPVRRVSAIVCISEATREALLRETGCDPEKVVVIPCCVSPEFRPKKKPFNSACPRVLQVGTGPNKNLERVIDALAGLDVCLVIVGPLSEAHREALARAGLEYENYVDLSREALRSQYETCDLLVFASTYEGFGLPIVEAQAVGRPVVTSNVASMPEVSGGATCLVDPLDVAGIRAGVQRIIDDSVYRQSLIDQGLRNAKRFAAPEVAERYAILYRRLAAR
jgi:glycosyltransferase involved in cell wall biosynthesis